MGDRLITEREEEAYRLCHHDFEGHTTGEAAELMGITPRAVRKLLESIRRKAPQLFPILTPLQARVLHCLTVEGMSRHEVADSLGVTEDTVASHVAAIRQKDPALLPGRENIRVLRFEDWMSDKVQEKF